MTTFSINDTIFATVLSGSTTLMNRTLHGASTVNDAMHMIRLALADHIGLVTVCLRNCTQGWTERRTVRLSHTTPTPTSPRQLTLF